MRREIGQVPQNVAKLFFCSILKTIIRFFVSYLLLELG